MNSLEQHLELPSHILWMSSFKHSTQEDTLKFIHFWWAFKLSTFLKIRYFSCIKFLENLGQLPVNTHLLNQSLLCTRQCNLLRSQLSKFISYYEVIIGRKYQNYFWVINSLIKKKWFYHGGKIETGLLNLNNKYQVPFRAHVTCLINKILTSISTLVPSTERTLTIMSCSVKPFGSERQTQICELFFLPFLLSSFLLYFRS